MPVMSTLMSWPGSLAVGIVAVADGIFPDAVDGAVAAVQHGIGVNRLAVVQILIPDGAVRTGAVEQISHFAGGELLGVLDAAAVHLASLVPDHLGIRIAVGDGAVHRAVDDGIPAIVVVGTADVPRDHGVAVDVDGTARLAGNAACTGINIPAGKGTAVDVKGAARRDRDTRGLLMVLTEPHRW